MEISRLYFDKTIRRICWKNTAIHCGEVLEVMILDKKGNPNWIITRLEKNDDYYLVGLKGINPVGLYARK